MTFHGMIDGAHAEAGNKRRLLWGGHRRVAAARGAPAASKCLAVTRNLNHFINLERDFRAFFLHSMFGVQEEICLCVQPPIRIVAAPWNRFPGFAF